MTTLTRTAKGPPNTRISNPRDWGLRGHGGGFGKHDIGKTLAVEGIRNPGFLFFTEVGPQTGGAASATPLSRFERLTT